MSKILYADVPKISRTEFPKKEELRNIKPSSDETFDENEQDITKNTSYRKGVDGAIVKPLDFAPGAKGKTQFVICCLNCGPLVGFFLVYQTRCSSNTK